MKPEIVITADGLHSLYLPELNEHYHSVHGALQEARHVFIEAGFNYLTGLKGIDILEIGFGTGLNYYLTRLEAIKSGRTIHYTGLELYPLAPSIIAGLNYTRVIGDAANETEFREIHQLPWGTAGDTGNGNTLKKLHMSVFDFNQTDAFDLIYFDAFGFRAQEEMWSQAVFDKMFDALRSGGVLVTYASKGEVRRRMQHSGFTVTKLPGPNGKREMVRALKQ